LQSLEPVRIMADIHVRYAHTAVVRYNNKVAPGHELVSSSGVGAMGGYFSVIVTHARWYLTLLDENTRQPGLYPPSTTHLTSAAHLPKNFHLWDVRRHEKKSWK